MLHRAILGSLELLHRHLPIEHHAGRFRCTAPVQVRATITSDADAYAREVLAMLGAAGLRAEADLNERENQLQNSTPSATPRWRQEERRR